MQLAQNLHEWARDKVEEHKEGREEDPLAMTAADIGAVLLDSQVPDAQVQAFAARFAESFGASAALNPANLISTGKFELEDRGRRGQSLARPLTGQPHRDPPRSTAASTCWSRRMA